MARKAGTTRSRAQSSTRSTARTTERRGKSDREATIERFTWAALVLAFAVLQLLPQEDVPAIAIPLAGTIILIGSGIYQSTLGYRVSLITWIGGIALLVLSLYNWRIDPNQYFFGESLLVFFGVILAGIVTGET